jgi:hypothetical protein
MTPVYSSGFTPDPFDARDVLAFILCPLEAFAPRADAVEREAVAEMIGPAKEEALRRWQEADARRQAN